MSKPYEWHGLTFEQWMKMWDRAGWREALGCTLYQIARSPDAETQDRLTALQTLNEGITAGLLLKDPGYPEMLRDVLLEIARGDTKPGWFVKRRRAHLHSRLLGVRWMLQTGAQFLAGLDHVEPEQSASVDNLKYS